MTLWRLEIARLVRTRKWVVLAGVFVFFGLTGPLVARYIEDILQRFGGGMQVTLPDPTPGDGITQFLSNAQQIGLLVVLVVAAGALAFDAKPELAAFLRTRVPGLTELVVPRYVVTVAAVCAAFALGVLGAWYETVVLLGPLPAGGMLAGTVYAWVYLAFAVAVVAFVSALARSVLTVIGISVVVLLALPILGVVQALSPWLPSALVGALDALARGADATQYLRAAAVSLVVTAGLLAATVLLLRRREL
jgi:ABC-2 type transport system permease protein